MLENKFQSKLIKDIKKEFPGCMVLKNDSSYLQGVPDLSIFYKDHYAMLEVKKSKNAKRQPNQEYYVDKLNEMSYASFVYPENRDRVMEELKRRFNE
jgi:hypothetical protein